METQPPNNISNGKLTLNQLMADEMIDPPGTATDAFEIFIKQFRPLWLDDLLTKLTTSAGKKSFLVCKGNKYVNVLTENIALFHIRYESTIIICFDNQSYLLNYSLEQIQSLLSAKQFYRLNRQYLINFDAVKDVEHYFSRKLLVNSVIPTEEKLIVSKEKVSEFLHWLDNR